jgi:hypothetical protein
MYEIMYDFEQVKISDLQLLIKNEIDLNEILLTQSVLQLIQMQLKYFQINFTILLTEKGI